MNQLYIVTGANGHLGNVVARKLIERKERVWLFLLYGEKPVVEGAERIYYGDVTEKETLLPLFLDAVGEKVVFIHCAGIVSIKSPFTRRLYDVNVLGTKNVADLCLEYKVEKLLYVSSVHAIPDNLHGETIQETAVFDYNRVEGHYAKSKAMATRYVLQTGRKGLPVNVVHPSGIIGPYDFGRSHTTTLIEDFLNGRLRAVMAGGYDFVDVRDVADGILSCAENGTPGACYLLTSRYYSLGELFEMLAEITGRRKHLAVLPLWFVKGTASLAELYYKMLKQPPLYTRYSIFTLGTNNRYSHARATKELGYAPREMKETLEDTCKWLYESGRIQATGLMPSPWKRNG
ncbi:NAD-dependent epimerase/dehydratase family protein [Proteiniclasticum sp. SCR006]|uniref:NAD-dependent epimerase/dehydratase family protein n=1 Tax=Proteiniclasticum aestuarii TaxID=2817862 RepID=A0A939HBW2_9CLOT|nr:NAD-dependent epimerase/dehydratase family protein [Proteiniclasticum aestuarii]MBO1265136.1 NAD-dependent epimerase/dehydratase family protein [Proteiniclasticum aestuarii]